MTTLTPTPDPIYNPTGNIVGNVFNGADGIYYLYNAENLFIGTFNATLNATYDAYGQFINYGNQFRAMLGV